MIDVIDKIRQLRELSKSSNIFEATAAAKAADKLLQKHRLTEEDLIARGVSQKEYPEDDSHVLYETARIITWKSILASVLARHYGCALWDGVSYETGHKVSRYKLVGRKSDMEMVRYLFAWLVFEIERLCKLSCKGKGHIVSQSFCEGAVSGIKQQLDKSKEEIKQEANQSGQSLALVRIDERLSESRTALYSLHKNLKVDKSVSYRRLNQDAYNNGISAGKNIHL